MLDTLNSKIIKEKDEKFYFTWKIEKFPEIGKKNFGNNSKSVDLG